MLDDHTESRQQRMTRQLGMCRTFLAGTVATLGLVLLALAVTSEMRALIASGLIGIGTGLLIVGVCV